MAKIDCIPKAAIPKKNQEANDGHSGLFSTARLSGAKGLILILPVVRRLIFDSGKYFQEIRALTKAKKPTNRKGRFGDTALSTPPIKGPITKPKPNP